MSRFNISVILAASIGFGAAFGGCGALVAQAADLNLPPIPSFSDKPETVQEWGSGWYLRGDLGFAKDSQPPINSDLSYTNPTKSRPTWSGAIGVGNKINNWLREDTTFELTNGMNSNGYSATTKTCQTGATLNSDGITYTAVNAQCYGKQHASLNRWNVMQNAYVDLGTWYGITPYVGAGGGLSHVTTAGSIAYYISGTGQAYNPTWTDGSGTHTVNWNITYVPKATTQLAWSLMGGLAIDASDHVKIDLGGRFVNSGRMTFVDSVSGNTIKKQLISRELKVGIRYMID
eukprot:gene13770-13888_t